MYTELITLENLFSAWDEFKKGKQNKIDVMQFERYLEDNLFALHDELSKKTYEHQPYHTFHVYDPKFRIINKAVVRDRVVHHLLYTFLEPIYQPRFIHHSYSSQKEKGIHCALEDIVASTRKASKNYTHTLWSLKMDIKKFFASFDQEALLNLLKQRVTDLDIVWLLEKIIHSYSTSPNQIGKGVPIGNVTSQIFANIYLSELDYFVKFNLRVKYYFRYADDFLILHEDKNYLESVCKIIQQFVQEKLLLTVHPNKIIFRKLTQGIDFVGYIILPHYQVLRTKTKQRVFKKMWQRIEAYNQGRVGESTLFQSLQSYLGVFKHCSAHELTERLKNEVFLRKEEKI